MSGLVISEAKERKLSLERDYIKKGEKTKLGGEGYGGIYRCRHTAKDYVIKRIKSSLNLNPPYPNPYPGNFRSFDEVLASRLLIEAGGSAPPMHVVYDEKEQAFVASERLPGTHDLSIEEFHKQPLSSQEKILSEQVIQAWLCNRDIVNIKGENFVIDKDKQIFQVDLGACLLSGFRLYESANSKQQQLELRDKKNFLEKNPVELLPWECKKETFGKLMTQSGNIYDMSNANQIRRFFKTDPEIQKHSYLQGVLQIMQISDQRLEEIIQASPHEPKDKRIILEGLKKRRDLLIQHAKEKYGIHALEEEKIALQFQRIMHKAGIFKTLPSSLIGDGSVSWHSQYPNAFKPEISIRDGAVFIGMSDSNRQRVFQVLEQLGIQCSMDSKDSKAIKINEPFHELNKKLMAAIVADGLQILLGSYGFSAKDGYKSPYSIKKPYKGSCQWAFRPVVIIKEEKEKQTTAEIELDPDAVAVEKLGGKSKFLPKEKLGEKFKSLLKEKYNLNEGEDYQVTGNKFIIFDAGKLFILSKTRIGARKTGIISENKEGQVMAGKLLPQTKGVNGFATAGGNSSRPMNPQKAAAEEGTDEFGYPVDETKLIPIGSTVPTRTHNLFIAPAGATEDKFTGIGYQEFINDSIRYYSFDEFRQVYKETKTQFDRTSIEYYVKFHQRQIQQVLQKMGFEDIIVICSKKPDTLGQVYLKPSIAHAKAGSVKSIKEAEKLEKLLKERGVAFAKQEKTSAQSKQEIKGITSVKREIYQLDSHINPAVLLLKLSQEPVEQQIQQSAKSTQEPAAIPVKPFFPKMDNPSQAEKPIDIPSPVKESFINWYWVLFILLCAIVGATFTLLGYVPTVITLTNPSFWVLLGIGLSYGLAASLVLYFLVKIVLEIKSILILNSITTDPAHNLPSEKTQLLPSPSLNPLVSPFSSAAPSPSTAPSGQPAFSPSLGSTRGV